MSLFLDEAAQREHRLRNRLHTVLLIGGIGGLLALCCWLIWGVAGLGVAAGAVAAFALLGSRVPPGAVMRMYQGQLVDPQVGTQLARIVTELAARAELPRRPRLYVIPSLTLNAFATGRRDDSAIGITEGLLRRLSMREIAGVLAHEISHIRNNDLWVLGIADAMTRLTQALSYCGLLLAVLNVVALVFGDQVVSWWAVLLLYLAPMASSLLQLGLSRAREYDADLEAAMLTGDPTGLASALRRIERQVGQFWEDLLFPVPGRRVSQPSLLRSHPSTEERVARLLDLESRPGLPAIVIIEEPMVSLIGRGPIEMRPRYRFPGIWY